MKPRIADPMRGTQYSQGDWSWIRSSLFLKWNDCDDRDMATATLIVFSASPELRARFERLCLNPDWTVALVDPFSLYVIVLDELWLQADGIMKKVADVFNGTETVRTYNFPTKQTHTPLLPISNRHNIKKKSHYIFNLFIHILRPPSTSHLAPTALTVAILSACTTWPNILSTSKKRPKPPSQSPNACSPTTTKSSSPTLASLEMMSRGRHSVCIKC